MVMNAAAAYQGTQINTASPAELTLLLYEGAIKFCNKALYYLECNKLDMVNTNLQKAQKIIMELRTTLDPKYAVSADFERVYAYIYDNLIDGNIKKDSKAIEEGLQYIREMRDTWKEVMRKNHLFVQ